MSFITFITPYKLYFDISTVSSLFFQRTGKQVSLNILIMVNLGTKRGLQINFTLLTLLSILPIIYYYQKFEFMAGKLLNERQCNVFYHFRTKLI